HARYHSHRDRRGNGSVRPTIDQTARNLRLRAWYRIDLLGTRTMAGRRTQRWRSSRLSLGWGLSLLCSQRSFWFSALIERETRARSSADRAGGFGPSGRGFDSCRARHPTLALVSTAALGVAHRSIRMSSAIYT